MSDEYPTYDRYIDEMPEPTDSQLQKIVGLANQYVDLAWDIERLKSQLALLEKQYNDLGNVMLPDAMRAVGLKEFQLENNYRLKVRDVLGCTLLKENVDKAEEWLEANGHSGLMKHELRIDVPKQHTLGLNALIKAVQGLGYKHEDIKRIHPQTLLKWAREMEENNDRIPDDIFNVYHGYKTEINK